MSSTHHPPVNEFEVKTSDQVSFQKILERLFRYKNDRECELWEKNNAIWDALRSRDMLEIRKCSELMKICFDGLSPKIRPDLWARSIPNRLSLTQKFYQICLQKARRKKEFFELRK